MSVLFANTRSPNSSKNSNVIVQFKAGRSEIHLGSETGKRKAVALDARGLVYLTVSNDNLLHFCWKNRDSNRTEDDYIIFPGDAEFLRIKECQDGRVYMLKFKSSDHRHLYWMQEPNADKDQDICKKVNDLLNNPAQRVVGARSASGVDRNNTNLINAALSNILGGGDASALGNMDQNQIMQFLMGSTGSGNLQQALMFAGSKPPATASTAEPIGTTSTALANQTSASGSDAGKAPSLGGNFTSADLAAMIAASNQKRVGSSSTSLDLSTLLTRGNIQNTVKKNSDQLQQFLPDQEPLLDSKSELEQTVGNPQFQQASDFFGQALQMGQLAQVLGQFGLKDDVVNVAETGDMLKFAEKLTEQEGSSKNVSKEIEAHADAEETINSSIKEAESKEKKVDESKVDLTKRPKDDDMELD